MSNMFVKHTYNEHNFRRQVDSALSRVKKILDTTRTPRYAEDEDHTYDDKYGLAEFLTNTAIAAQANVLERLGMDSDKLGKLHSFAIKDKRPVTLRFEAKEDCRFLKEEVVEVEAKRLFVTETEEVKTTQGKTEEKKTQSRHKVVTKVTEYHWKISMSYVVYAFAGNDPESSKMILQSREASQVVVTFGGKRSPFPPNDPIGLADLPLTWLLQNIAQDSLDCNFSINRLTETCRTPRRNEDISAALSFFEEMSRWSKNIVYYFLSVSEKIATAKAEGPNHRPLVESEPVCDLVSINSDDVFVPVLPLFEAPSEAEDDSARVPTPTENKTISSLAPKSPDRLVSICGLTRQEESPLLPIKDINSFLDEQCRSLDMALLKLASSFPPSNSQTLISVAEAAIVLLSQHIYSITDHIWNGVGYIEGMLRSQLVAAVGKEVNTEDFDEFILFNNKKLFKSDFVPKSFCHAIRRPEHYPDGVLSIERGESGFIFSRDRKIDPVATFVRKFEGSSAPMFFPINAATSIEFTGERFLHAWVCHQFGGENERKNTFNLVARARQFSSFLLLIGTVSGPDSFDPQHAIILQNKDEVLIPLLLNQLPTPKEFKDAIKSLSPEQQRFAKAFRSMQLESSVFGVCAVQLKPQLEVLLGLPHNSLTKEVRLTQDLLSLFIDYQISSDLLSFDGDMSMAASEKVGIVKGHVAAVQEMIEDVKKKDLRNAEQEADMRVELSDHYHHQQQGLFNAQPPAPSGGFFFGAAPPPMSCGAAPPPMSFGVALPPVACPPAETTFCASAQDITPASTYALLGTSATIPADASSFGGDNSTNKPISHDQSQLSKSKEPFTYIESNDTRKAHGESTLVNFTLIPKQLDAKFEELDSDSALRPTMIKIGDIWTRKMQQNLLTKMSEETLATEEQKEERNKAFDLLDALSRSGSLPIACAELHVFVAATHCFENSLMATVIEDNTNPIEKMEKSMLIVASTIFDSPPALLLKNKSEEERMVKYSPALFIENEEE